MAEHRRAEPGNRGALAAAVWRFEAPCAFEAGCSLPAVEAKSVIDAAQVFRGEIR